MNNVSIETYIITIILVIVGWHFPIVWGILGYLFGGLMVLGLLYAILSSIQDSTPTPIKTQDRIAYIPSQIIELEKEEKTITAPKEPPYIKIAEADFKWADYTIPVDSKTKIAGSLTFVGYGPKVLVNKIHVKAHKSTGDKYALIVLDQYYDAENNIVKPGGISWAKESQIPNYQQAFENDYDVIEKSRYLGQTRRSNGNYLQLVG